jgi:monovalent cation:H+ antiporter, CPA1 family
MADIGLIITVFLLVTFIAAIISHWLKTPYTLILVLMGIAITGIATALTFVGGPVQSLAESVIAQIRSFENLLVEGGGTGLFVALIVPPLIFESMMHVRAGELRSVIKPSLALATIGVAIATVTGGLVLWKLFGLPFYVAFLFSALIAPTDVVTILEVFKRVKVPSKLALIMNTESALNDATAILIFTVILSAATLHQTRLFDALGSFGYTLLGGFFVGLGIAFLAEILSSLIEDRVAETILTISAVYGSFALASGIGASGLIAVAVTGLYFGNFTRKAAMEPATRKTIQTFWEVIAFLANSVAFLFIGFQTNLLTLTSSIALIAAAFVAVTIARAATVYPIFAFFRRRGEKIPRVWGNVALLGGVRGALSIVLATTITVSAVVTSSDVLIIRTMALGVAFVSIIFQVPILFRYAQSKFKDEHPSEHVKLDEKLALVCASLEETRRLRSEGKLSEEEFEDQLEYTKDKIDETIHESESLPQTTVILRERFSLLYQSLRNRFRIKKKEN